MPAKQVEIIVTNTVVGSYEARSYPHEQQDQNGFYPLYRVPVYKIIVKGTDANNRSQSFEFMAPRFMPYYNDPQNPDHHYTAKGWLNAGLASGRKIVISRYKQDYRLRNRYSPGVGAIVLKDTFYIHAGPAALEEVGFGSAGCIEIIGNYDTFKDAIVALSGLPPGSVNSTDSIIQQLVNSKKLIVTVQTAVAPDIKNSFTRKIR